MCPPCCLLIAGIGKKEKTKEEEEQQIKKFDCRWTNLVNVSLSYVPDKADGHNLCVRPCCRLIAGIGKKKNNKRIR